MEQVSTNPADARSREAIIRNTDFEVADEHNASNADRIKNPTWYNLKYTIVGIVFGIVFIKAEIASWFRIQEMFRLQSFHMYGVIGTAVIVGIISVWIIKKFRIKTIAGSDITFQPKTFNKGQIYGGILFGLGWAMTGACPGPLFAQISSGFVVVFVVLISAIAGTWVYGFLKERLPV
ncbi:MAG: transporter [Chitinophagaceae bacterium]|nr:MAG: transporter [Chitinophagaceae bacterium]